MTSYRVLSGASAKSLEEQVTDLMSEGYVPIGGATVVEAGSRMIESALRGNGMIRQVELLFSQAMLKHDEQPVPEPVENSDRDDWILKRLETYSEYWNEKEQRYVIIEKGADQGDGTASGDEIWKPTRDELLADIERSYDFEHGDQS